MAKKIFNTMKPIIPQFSKFDDYYANILFQYVPAESCKNYFLETDKEKRESIVSKKFDFEKLDIYKYSVFIDTVILNFDHLTGINSKAIESILSPHVKSRRHYYTKKRWL